MQKARDRGLDVDHLQETYARCINKALEAKPADMTITTHVCRGNFRSTFISSGGYEPVAETLLAKCNYDGYFLEYDTDRAGGFEPLRFLPKGNKIVVLGLVTSKQGRLEPREDIKRRIEEATKFVALDQLCLSPQCGFASTEEGNVLAEDEQWAKLKHDRGTGRGSLGEVVFNRRPREGGDPVTPASRINRRNCVYWMPACAGMTVEIEGAKQP